MIGDNCAARTRRPEHQRGHHARDVVSRDLVPASLSGSRTNPGPAVDAEQLTLSLGRWLERHSCRRSCVRRWSRPVFWRLDPGERKLWRLCSRPLAAIRRMQARAPVDHGGNSLTPQYLSHGRRLDSAGGRYGLWNRVRPLQSQLTIGATGTIAAGTGIILRRRLSSACLSRFMAGVGAGIILAATGTIVGQSSITLGMGSRRIMCCCNR